MHHEELTLTTGRERFTDLTGRARRFVGEAGGDGLLNVFVPHATAGVALFELHAGSEEDLSRVLDEVLVRDDRWRHAHGSPGHGADHVLPALVAPSVVVPVQDGELLLGTWQSIVLVDTNVDNPRRRVHLSLLT
jgi:secondary thiamine-phosphate synthase enzyme